jgi:3-oxoacyl-[acyl-carrier-protein] synthase II
MATPADVPRSRVLVTGVGVLSPIGSGKERFYGALERGESGAAPVTQFSTENLGRSIACEVKDFHAGDHLSRAEARRMGRCSAMALAAARMALRDANLSENSWEDRTRVAVVIGTTMGEADVLEKLDQTLVREGPQALPRSHLTRVGSTLLPIHIARAIGSEGPTMTLPAACAAGNYALGLAYDLIRTGKADVVLAGASELIQQLQFSGFVRLAAMAPDRCRPFDKDRQGILLGEGAAVFVLESEEHAARRGAKAQAEVGGFGLTCDAYHITRPHPDAAGSVEAMRRAIREAGLEPGDVDFVNAHGTGTKANDTAESAVMREVFGGRAVPISSMKSMFGHCMGAASAIEAAACLFTVESGIYPPTIHFETPDPECPVALVANTAKRGAHRVVVNNSLAFGGYNAVTLFAQPGVLAPTSERPQRFFTAEASP